MPVEGGQIHLGHEEYEYVILPGVDALPLPVARRLLEFYEAGGTVISLGPSLRIELLPGMEGAELIPKVPIRSADGRHDDEVKQIVAKIWGAQASGRGKAHVTTYKDVSTLFYSLDAHDVWINPNLTLLQYYHRRLSGRDLYFFNNEGEEVTTTVRLRNAQGIPEFWDLVTGSICQAPCYSATGKEIALRLHLDRYESVFVVLNPSARPLPHVVSTNADEVLRVSDGRIVLRQYKPGALRYGLAQPDGKIEHGQAEGHREELAPIEIHEGWARTPFKPNGATYKAHFHWPQASALSAMLMIEDMMQVIHVSLNGKDLGMRFTYPFHFDLGSALQPGLNELELKHVERYTFTSKLGKVTVRPFCEVRV